MASGEIQTELNSCLRGGSTNLGNRDGQLSGTGLALFLLRPSASRMCHGKVYGCNIRHESLYILESFGNTLY